MSNLAYLKKWNRHRLGLTARRSMGQSFRKFILLHDINSKGNDQKDNINTRATCHVGKV